VLFSSAASAIEGEIEVDEWTEAVEDEVEMQVWSWCVGLIEAV
jgi:hypothetical protein